MDIELPVSETTTTHLSLGKSVAIAECLSSAVSLGTVWLVGQHPKFLAPAKEFLAEHIVYPVMCKHVTQPLGPEDKEALMKKAAEKASLFLKGVVMVGASFMTHIPTQMMLEGRYDVKEFKKVLLGKSIGLTMAMGTLAATNYVKPGAIQHVEDTLSGGLLNCEKAPSPEDCAANKELCKLMVIDIPSSIVSGLVNYQLTRRL